MCVKANSHLHSVLGCSEKSLKMISSWHWMAVTTSPILPMITSSFHYDYVTMSSMASQITSLTIVYSTVYSGADQRKHQSSAPLAFVRGIHRGPVNSPHKWPVTRKVFPFDDVIMYCLILLCVYLAYQSKNMRTFPVALHGWPSCECEDPFWRMETSTYVVFIVIHD